MDLVTVRTFHDPALAQVCRTALEAEGIPAFVQDDSVMSVQLYSKKTGSVQLRVREEDLARAAEFLGQEATSSEVHDEPQDPLATEQAEASVRGESGSTNGLLRLILALLAAAAVYYLGSR